MRNESSSDTAAAVQHLAKLAREGILQQELAAVGVKPRDRDALCRSLGSSRWRRCRWLLWKIGILLVIGTLGGVCLELLLPRSAVSSSFPFHAELYPYVGFRQPSNYVWQSPGPSPSSRTGERSLAVNNEDGFRIPAVGYELAKEKPPGQLRIAVVGGSTVHGGTTFETSLPGALKCILVERWPARDIEVINAGTIGAIARQELVALVTTIVDYDPDLLIVYDGINDSGQMLYFEQRVGFPYHFAVLEEAWRRFMADQREPLWRLALGRSATVRRLFPGRFAASHYYNRASAEDLIHDPELRRPYGEEFVRSWSKILRVCAAYDIEPFFVLQPCSLYGKFSSKDAEATPHSELFANYLLYEDFREAVCWFAAAHPDVGVRDYAELIPEVDGYWDGAHVFDDVNTRIAEALFDLIRPRIDER